MHHTTDKGFGFFRVFFLAHTQYAISTKPTLVLV